MCHRGPLQLLQPARLRHCADSAGSDPDVWRQLNVMLAKSVTMASVRDQQMMELQHMSDEAQMGLAAMASRQVAENADADSGAEAAAGAVD